MNHVPGVGLYRAVAIRSQADARSRAFSPELVALEPLTEELESEWEELANAAGASPFNHPGWIGAWWNAFGRGKLEIITVRRGGRLTAVLPMRRRLGALTSPSNWHTPHFGPVASDRVSLRLLACELFAQPPRRVSLAFLDSESETTSFLREAAAESGFRVLDRTLERSPYVKIDRPWVDYEQSLTRDARRDAKRRLRRLGEKGAIKIDVRDGSEQLEGLLSEGFRVEASGWKGSSRSAIGSQPETEMFYRAVARWAAAHGWLRLAFLRVDGIPIAFHYCLEHAGVHYVVKGGHDSAYSKYSPGKVLTYSMLSRAFTIGLSTYEFLGADDPWKLLWTSSMRRRLIVHAFRPAPDGVMEWAIFNYGRRSVRRAANLQPIARLRQRR